MTTNTNDLRAAAERFLPGDSYNSIAQADTDAYLLANAYLAEHPADDDEPVIVDWMDATAPDLGVCHQTHKSYRLAPSIRLVAQPFVGGWLPCELWIGGGDSLTSRKVTRRDVRQLLRSLGGSLFWM